MKIMIYFEDNGYIRNYIRTNAFAYLRHHSLIYAVSENVTMTEAITTAGEKLYRLSSTYIGARAYRFASRLQMYNRSKKNKGFLFRLRRELIRNILTLIYVPNSFRLGPYSRWRMLLNRVLFKSKFLKVIFIFALSVLKPIVALIWDIPGLVLYLTIAMLTKLKLNKVITWLLLHGIPLNKHMKFVCDRERPDLLIIPSSVVEACTYELIRISKKRGSPKVLVLIDNWDNLSSKSAFIQNPDYLSVWGEQSFRFATDFHYMPPERIRVIGTPRFGVYTNYLKNMSVNLRSNNADRNSQPYILFAGCAVGFDEIGALKAVHSAFQLIRDSLPIGTQIIYRPHPWGGRSSYLELLKRDPLDGVVIDPQISASKEEGGNFQPCLDYYPRLIDDALFVICPLSSMIIESTIMNKQVLALAHDDSLNLLSPNRILANYKHFDGLKNLENIVLVPNLSLLPALMIRAYERRFEATSPEGLKFFVLTDQDNTYSERLADFVEDIQRDIPPQLGNN